MCLINEKVPYYFWSHVNRLRHSPQSILCIHLCVKIFGILNKRLVRFFFVERTRHTHAVGHKHLQNFIYTRLNGIIANCVIIIFIILWSKKVSKHPFNDIYLFINFLANKIFFSLSKACCMSF